VQPSPALVAFVHDWFAAASSGDRSLVDAAVAQSDATLLIGSDPDEILRGSEAVTGFLLGELEGAAGSVTFEPAEVKAYESGGLGWASALLTITIPDGGQVSPRWTAVFTRESGAWQVVHIHASIGITNEQVGWVYPD
jgi:ketosteroid isomerase-like protein